MAPDERDRSFDKAVARHLRADSSLQDSANSLSRSVGPTGECPGPETLAAYHERSLFPEEMNSWKEHIVGCASCQTILSTWKRRMQFPSRPRLKRRSWLRKNSRTSRQPPATPACGSRNSSQAIPPRAALAWRALAMARSRGSSRRQSACLDRAA